jgi:hypothetical protein
VYIFRLKFIELLLQNNTMLYYILFTLLIRQVLSADPFSKSITYVPAAIQDGPSQGQFISSGNGLDSPKIHPVNGSAYDWWYFDAVSDDAKASLVIVFYTASPAGFPAASFPSTVDSITIDAEFPNGTSFAASIPASSATIVTVGDGTTGIFEGTGSGWTSTPDMTRYLLTVDAPSFGIKGTFQLDSVSTPVSIFRINILIVITNKDGFTHRLHLLIIPVVLPCTART